MWVWTALMWILYWLNVCNINRIPEITGGTDGLPACPVPCTLPVAQGPAHLWDSHTSTLAEMEKTFQVMMRWTHFCVCWLCLWWKDYESSWWPSTVDPLVFPEIFQLKLARFFTLVDLPSSVSQSGLLQVCIWWEIFFDCNLIWLSTVMHVPV